MAEENRVGNGTNQLNFSWGLFVDNNQTVYIANYLNHYIMTWKCGATTDRVVADENGAGKDTEQLNYPADVIVSSLVNLVIKKVVR
ncbi:unnamed protein product [Rotaria sp. Silwood2]|nr:unnamed protein product [Rotaria sp. Silwood2]CAF4025386.1 unnamed protein product [Rotaria sp. Silwood2]